jgi:tetratricopeptide (TPR) repeat protein
MGIGLSGVVYALFGYIALADRYDGRYRGFIPIRTKQLFIIWLFLCIAATRLNFFSVGNGAHIGGLIWGALIGFLRGKKSMWGVIPALMLLGLSLVPAFWAPWQLPWLEERAFQLHKQLNIDEALKLYNVILSKYPDDSFAIGNKKVIVDYKVYYLRDTAMTALSLRDFKTSIRYFDKILLLDSGNVEAKAEEAAIHQFMNGEISDTAY